jgi:choice-of-anchor B domain-containing protein
MLKRNLLGLMVLCLGVATAQTNASLNFTSLGTKTYTSTLNDIWGWTDSTGTEYALVGTTTGFSIVDISTPSSPVEKFFISGPTSTWRDIKTWGHYAYVTHDSYSGTSQGLLIVDLSDIDTAQNISYTSYFYTHTDEEELDRAHNLYIDENGVCYLFGSNIGVGGALMFDLTTNPTSPAYLGIYDDYYLHDGMARGDTLWGGAIYAGKFVAVDVSSPGTPVNLGSASTPNTFCHNAWISQDGETVFTTDEVSSAFVAAYDVTNMSNIQELDRVQPYPGTGVIPHNAHVSGQYVVTSWYTAGVRVHDATYPYNLVEVGFYDTSPFSGSGFNGDWGAYPFFPSGLIACSDMQTGLHVLQPDYQSACWLEGDITDAATGLPVSAAQVEIIGEQTKEADLAGFYATGVANAGTFDVVYNKAGYHSDTVTITFANGVLTTQDVQLNALYTFNVNGSVTDVNGGAVTGAQITISNAQTSFSGVSNSNGGFVVPAIFDGFYEIVISAWGYQTQCYSDHLDSTNYLVNVQLETGYYDDFTTDMGWMIQSNASTGIWVRDEPIGTTYGPNFFNPDLDVSGDCGNEAFITGNGGGQAGTDDVDDGFTTLISPVMDLSNYSDPYLSYYTWFANAGGAGTPNDSLIVRISDGTTTVDLEYITALNPQSQWVMSEWRIEDHITKGSNMRVFFKTADYASLGGHLVEAGVDQFMVWDSLSIGIDVTEELTLNVFPNPSQGWLQVDYAWNYSEVEMDVLDLRGRVVQNAQLKGRRGESALILDAEPGTYLIRFSYQGESFRTERIILQ